MPAGKATVESFVDVVNYINEMNNEVVEVKESIPEDIETFASSITDLQETSDTLSDGLSDVVGDISTLQTQHTSLESTVTTQGNTIVNHKLIMKRISLRI